MLELKLKSWMDLHNLVLCQDMHIKKGRKELTTSFQECSWHEMKCTLTFKVFLNYQSANSLRNYYELLLHNALCHYFVIFVHLCHWYFLKSAMYCATILSFLYIYATCHWSFLKSIFKQNSKTLIKISSSVMLSKKETIEDSLDFSM